MHYLCAEQLPCLLADNCVCSGTSLVLVSGQEQTAYMNICRTLKKGVGGLELMPVTARPCCLCCPTALSCPPCCLCSPLVCSSLLLSLLRLLSLVPQVQQKRLPPLRTRLRLAKNLDKEEHSTSKKKARPLAAHQVHA